MLGHRSLRNRDAGRKHDRAAGERRVGSHTRRGALTVEVALIMPVFILFLFAIMEFGHFCLVSHTLHGAARRGALLGSYEGVTNAQVETKVKSIVNAAINADQATILIKDASIFDSGDLNAASIDYNGLPSVTLEDAERGDCFLVQVKVPYDNVSLLPTFFIKGATIVGQAAIRHE
jgi:Flp pilus assembly protein TadG